MIQVNFKKEIDYDNDFAVITEIENNKEHIIWQDIYNYWKMEGCITDDEDYENDIIDNLESSKNYNDKLNCYEYKNYRLYILGTKVIIDK